MILQFPLHLSQHARFCAKWREPWGKQTAAHNILKTTLLRSDQSISPEITRVTVQVKGRVMWPPGTGEVRKGKRVLGNIINENPRD